MRIFQNSDKNLRLNPDLLSPGEMELMIILFFLSLSVTCTGLSTSLSSTPHPADNSARGRVTSWVWVGLTPPVAQLHVWREKTKKQLRLPLLLVSFSAVIQT